MARIGMTVTHPKKSLKICVELRSFISRTTKQARNLCVIIHLDLNFNSHLKQSRLMEKERETVMKQKTLH